MHTMYLNYLQMAGYTFVIYQNYCITEDKSNNDLQIQIKTKLEQLGRLPTYRSRSFEWKFFVNLNCTTTFPN